MDAVKHCPPDMTWLSHLRTPSSYGNLHEMEPINISLQMEEGAYEAPSSLKRCWQLMMNGGVCVIFFNGVDIGKLLMLQ